MREADDRPESDTSEEITLAFDSLPAEDSL